MKTRPLSVTIISWLFIVVGIISLLGGLQPFTGIITGSDIPPFSLHETLDLALASATLLLAIIGGIFMLKGFNWARWLLVLWMVFHIIISLQGTLWIIIFHCVIFGAITYFLFRKNGSDYFINRPDTID
ncbi:MAG TPA: hypothetical protein VJ964_11975 [Balneolaceae bacterium]|nr:hypothetical protein [Balneolaceae bacterium]